VNAQELLNAGQLTEAIAAAKELVKSSPKELEHRWLLGELLILAGDYDRADAQFDTMMTVEPKAAVAVTPIRQLLRAESARRQFYDDGRVPELLDGASQAVRDRLESFVLLRDGKNAEAGKLAEQAEIARPALAGSLTIGGETRSFEDFRDLDDITAGVLEVYTQTGKYYWVEMSSVERISFTPPQRPLDLLWREAQLEVKDTFDATVHIPAVYGTVTGTTDALRLGRETEWLGEEGEVILGVGRRLFVINAEEEVDSLAIESLAFAPPA
jgi:type VI secretion system protein ImpE